MTQPAHFGAGAEGAGSCIACSGAMDLFGPYKTYTYYRCRDCRSIQLSPMPTEQEMVIAYRDEYARGKQEGQYADPAWWPRVSKPYCDSIMDALNDAGVRGIVVDCGAGWGGLVQAMQAAGFDARGVELSQTQVDYAKQHGIPLTQGDLASLADLKGKVSAVTLLAVFEHLVNHGKLLGDLHAVLKDDGIFVTLHPTGECNALFWNLIRLGRKDKPLPHLDGSFAAPWHTALLSIKASNQIITRHGFELIEVRPAPQGRWGGWVSAIQIALETFNTVGWAIFGQKWPFLTSHVFVYRKVAST